MRQKMLRGLRGGVGSKQSAACSAGDTATPHDPEFNNNISDIIKNYRTLSKGARLPSARHSLPAAANTRSHSPPRMTVRARRVAVRLVAPSPAHNIYLQAVNAMRCHMIKALPPWAVVMRLVPPAQPPQRMAPPLKQDMLGATGFEAAVMRSPSRTAHYRAQCPTGASAVAFDASAYARDLPGVERRLNPTLRATDIRFPEDALRERFYSDHPFELVRNPASLAEPPDASVATRAAAPLTKTQAEASGCDEISGEDVVMRQLFLVARGHSVDKAYELALKEFYDVRVRQESASKAKLPAKSAANEASQTTLQAAHPVNYPSWMIEEAEIQKAQRNTELKLSLPSETGVIFEK